MTNESMVIEADLNGLYEYSLQFNRWFLKPIGAWPPSSSASRLEKIVSYVVIVISYCLILTTVVPSIFHVILEDESIHLKLKILGPLSHWFAGGINYTTLLMHGKQIRYCLEHMEIDWKSISRHMDQRVMLTNAKLGRYVAAFCAAFMQGGVFCHCFAMTFTTKTIVIGNETRIVRLLPCAAYSKLVAADTSPVYEILLASQFASGFIATSSIVGAFSLAAVFAAHACGQLNLLMIWITEFVDQSRNRNKVVHLNEIGAVVEHHLRSLSFIAGIENVMNRICFVELLKCTLSICVLTYYILTEWADRDIQNLTTYFIILLSMCFNIFTVCFIGEILTEKCKKVGDVVYTTNWYCLPEKDILDLILIIARSSMVIKITAGKLVRMSMYTFTDVMKSAFAYLNILLQTTGNL